MIASGSQLIHANMLTKPMTLQTITTSAGGTTQIISGCIPSIISVSTAGGTSYVSPQQGVTHARLISVNPTSSMGLKQSVIDQTLL